MIVPGEGLHGSARRVRRLLRAGLLVVAALGMPPASWAAPQGEASEAAFEQAKARYEQGLAALGEKDYPRARALFEQSYGLHPGISTLFYLGVCDEFLGRFVMARKTYLDVVEQGMRDGDPALRDTITEAQKRADTLALRIGKLALDLRAVAGYEGLEVSLDAAPLDQAGLEEGIFVDPGTHTVKVATKGKPPWETKVVIVAQQTLKLVVPVPIAPAPKQAQVKKAPSPTPQRPDAQPQGGGSMRWIGWAATGTFTADAVVFGVLALRSSSELGELKTMDAPRQDLEDKSAETVRFAVVSDVFTGAAIIAGGISLYLTFRDGPSNGNAGARRAAPRIQMGIAPGGVTLRGQF